MVTLSATIGKFVILIALIVFLLVDFKILKSQTTTILNRFDPLGFLCIFLLHFAGYLVIWFKNQEEEVLYLYGAQLLYFILIFILFPVCYRKINRPLLMNMAMLVAIGEVIVGRLSLEKEKKQFIIVCVVTIVTLIIPWIMESFEKLYRLKNFYFIVGIGLLLAVLIMGVTSRGAKLSLSLGSISIQPSEFVKIIFVFFIASVLSQKTDFKTVVITTVEAAVFVLSLVASTDLGSALIFFIVYVFMLYVATKKSIYLLLGLGGGSFASIVAYKLFSHVRIRVATWLDPWEDISNTGYQITQSLFAIGSGGWFGKGLYQGQPTDVPIITKDFIIAAIAEEMGGLVSILLILLCMTTFLFMIKIAMMQNNNFNKLIAVGLGISYAFQVFLTVGGATKMIPLTGVTMPLVSYGGSSALCTLISFAILQGLSVKAVKEEKLIERQKIRREKKFRKKV